MQVMSDEMLRIIRINFRSQGRRSGGSWKRITPRWAKQKRREGLDPRILFASGRLEQSFHRDGPNQKIVYSKRGFTIRSTVPYAAVHQYGFPGKNIRARPFVKFSQHDKRMFAKLLQEYLLQEFSGKSTKRIRLR